MSELTEDEKKEFIKNFLDNVELFLEKKRFVKKSRRTKVSSKPAVSTWPLGLKKEYTLKNKEKELTFYVEARPWLWSDGTLWLEIEFKDGKKLVIPKNMVKPKSQGNIWKPDFDPITFLQNTTAVANYISAIEMTLMDVGLFDSMKAVARNFFGK